MSGEEKKVKRLRTFADDFAHARFGEVSETKIPTPADQIQQPVETTPTPAQKTPVSDTLKTPTPVAEVKNTKPIPPPKEDFDLPQTPTTPKSTIPTETKAEKTAGLLRDVKVDVSEVTLDESESLLTTDDDVFDVAAANSEVGEGTIITDRKRKRFKLLPAMAEMVGDWINDTVERFEPEPEVKPRIASSEDRSEVLEKAATRRVLAPRDDYQALTQRKVQPTEQSFENSFEIKDEKDIPTPAWTHLKPDTEPKISAAPELTTPGRNLERFSVPTETFPQPTTPATEAVPPAEPAVPTPAPTPKAPDIPQPTPKPTTSANPTVKQRETPPPPQYLRPTSRLSIFSKLLGALRFMSVAVIAIGLGVWVSLWIFNYQNNQVTVQKEVVPSLIKAEEQIPVAIASDPETLLKNILAVRPRSTTVVAHVYPTISNEPASTEELLSVLEWRAPQGFLRSIKEVNFGYYRNQEPFVVLNISSFDVGLTGMLEWEDNLSHDLSPFFGPTVTGTFDPRINSVAEVVEPYYYDDVVANYDVRILNDEKQEERIVYSLLNRNTILITTTSEALEALANAVK